MPDLYPSLPPEPPPSGPPPLVELIRRWLETSELDRRCFIALTHELGSASALVENSTVNLCDRFHHLVESARAQATQMDAIIGIATTVKIESQRVPISEAFKTIEEALQTAIETILYVSKHAMRMVYALEDISKDVIGAEQCATQIEQINKKARYLALNATIEASRSGKEGAAFAVIAHEMKDLATATETTSNQVRQRISAVVQGVSNGQTVLKEIATKDLSENILAKEKIDWMIHAIIQQNSEFSEVLTHTSTISSEIAANITDIITSMQFQDRTKQHLSQVSETLLALEQGIQTLQNDTVTHLPELQDYDNIDQARLNHIIDQQTLGEMKHRLINRLLNNPHPTHETSFASSHDDIELF